MKILHVIDSLGIGGAEKMLAVIASEFFHRGHHVEVCASRNGGATEGLIAKGIPVHILGRKSRYDLRGLVSFRQLVERGKFDVIHAHGRSTGAFVGTAKALFGMPSAIVLHDHYGGIHIDRTVPLSFGLVTRRVLACYAGVSEELVTWAKQAGVAADRTFCILNALPICDQEGDSDPERGEVSGVETENCQTGVCLAGLRREKGILELIDAVARIPLGLRFQILVVGGTRDAEYVSTCRRAIQRQGLNERIKLVGEVPKGRALLKQADFAVIPSLSESGPLVLIEAMLEGVPFVCTRTGGVAEATARAGLNAFVTPGSSEELAREIQLLLEMDDAARRDRGEAARQFAKAKFDIRGRVSEWLTVYEKALSVSS